MITQPSFLFDLLDFPWAFSVYLFPEKKYQIVRFRINSASIDAIKYVRS